MKQNNAIIKTILHYVEITAPIALYVIFECIHKDKWTYFITSPEWGIASIFLAFLSITTFISSSRKMAKENNIDVNETKIKAFVFLRMTLIILTSIVTFMSVMDDNKFLKIFRISLFIIISIIFIILTLSANINKNKN